MLSLAAYENKLSRVARQFLCSPLSERYHLGTVDEHRLSEVVVKGDLMFQGLPGVYELATAADAAVKALFKVAACELRVLSGVHGMMTTIGAATDPGDLILSLPREFCGHFATQHIIERSGRRGMFLPCKLSRLEFDLDALTALVKKQAPRAVFFDHGAPLFPLPTADIRQIVGDECLLIYDASHTLGLIAGGQFQDPLREGCDILQGNTHKSFPGAQKGLILFRDARLGAQVMESVANGFVSSQHTHHALAQYVTILEMQRFAREYAQQMICNTKILARELARYGFELVHRDNVVTQSHVLLIEGGFPADLYEACRKLLACHLATNARDCFGRTVVRIGTQEVTRRGMKEEDMPTIAAFFKRILIDDEDLASVRRDVMSWNKVFPNIHYSLDKELGYWSA